MRYDVITFQSSATGMRFAVTLGAANDAQMDAAVALWTATAGNAVALWGWSVNFPTAAKARKFAENYNAQANPSQPNLTQERVR